MGKVYDRIKAKSLKKTYKPMFFGPESALAAAYWDGGTKRLVKVVKEHSNKRKGHFQGLCNRSSCLSPDEVEWYNYGSLAFYCPVCADELNYYNPEGFNGKQLLSRLTAEEAKHCHVSTY